MSAECFLYCSTVEVHRSFEWCAQNNKATPKQLSYQECYNNNIKVNRSSIYWPEINQITFITCIKHLKASTYPKISAIKQYNFTIKLMKLLIDNYTSCQKQERSFFLGRGICQYSPYLHIWFTSFPGSCTKALKNV